MCLAVCLQLANQAFAFVPLSSVAVRRTMTTSISMGGGRSQSEKLLTKRQVTDKPELKHRPHQHIIPFLPSSTSLFSSIALIPGISRAPRKAEQGGRNSGIL